MTHICVSKLTIIGRRQAIIWTSAGILLIGPSGTNSSEIVIAIYTFSFKQKYFKMSSVKWRPSCLGLNELIWQPSVKATVNRNRINTHIHQDCADLQINADELVRKLCKNKLYYGILLYGRWQALMIYHDLWNDVPFLDILERIVLLRNSSIRKSMDRVNDIIMIWNICLLHHRCWTCIMGISRIKSLVSLVTDFSNKLFQV